MNSDRMLSVTLPNGVTIAASYRDAPEEPKFREAAFRALYFKAKEHLFDLSDNESLIVDEPDSDFYERFGYPNE